MANGVSSLGIFLVIKVSPARINCP